MNYQLLLEYYSSGADLTSQEIDLLDIELYSQIESIKVSSSQGCLEVMYELEIMLNKITGMDSTTVQPSAGSQGEYAGILVMSKYHEMKGNNKKTISMVINT